jgi:predicted transcriptional regulator
MARKDDQLNVRLPKELKSELMRIAREQDRTMAWLVEQVLREFVEAQASAPSKSPRR